MTARLLVLGRDAIRDLLPMSRCIALMRDAMVLAIHPEAQLPLRRGTPIPGTANILSIMPGSLPADDCIGAKVITVFPGNFDHGRPSHQGGVLIFDQPTGRPLALFDAGEITAIRTAAASALATDLLARPDAQVLTICGYGEQAGQHLVSMQCVRNLSEVRIWGRSIDPAEAFVRRLQPGTTVPMRAVPDLGTALEGADIVCTTTASTEAWLPGALLRPGMHLNLVGSSSAAEREADDEVVTRGRIYVDLMASTMAQAGEILACIEQGLITQSHIVGAIGSLIEGRIAGRQSADDITVYKSLGIAAQDLVSTAWLYREASRRNAGVWVEF